MNMTAVAEASRMRPGRITPLTDAAAALLRETRGIVAAVEATQYTRGCDAADGGTIGQHVRHLAAHFDALTHGFENDSPVHYDRRARGTVVETDPVAAIELLDQLLGEIDGLDDVQLHMPVRIRVLPSPGEPEIDLDSSLGRELAFVTHHAIHHHAMMKFIAGQLGVPMEAGVGRAPSTQQADTKQAGTKDVG
ncbi:MAG: DinB family protein [Planctomycetota bacterium]